MFKVLASVEKIKLLNIPLLYYRQDNPASSINNPNKVFCVCDEYEELTRFLNNRNDLKEIFNTQKLINQYRAYLWNIRRLDKSLCSQFLEKFSETFKIFYNKGEIKNDFFKSVKKSEFMVLINRPSMYYEKIIKKNLFYWFSQWRFAL